MPILPILQASSRVPNYIFFYVILLGVFYFLLIRPQQVQQRKRRAMLGKLKKGDRVVTAGGLHATIHDVDEETLTLELAPNFRVKADRSAVSYVRGRKPEATPSPVSESGPPRP
ncbi:MAG TPA: preprotein translocase subunit YajC [bacterium]|nr:preprotein translocase subunit YajC [bacterium]